MKTLEDLRRATRALEHATAHLDSLNAARDGSAQPPLSAWQSALAAVRSANKTWHETWDACTTGNSPRYAFRAVAPYYWSGGTAR